MQMPKFLLEVLLIGFTFESQQILAVDTFKHFQSKASDQNLFQKHRHLVIDKNTCPSNLPTRQGDQDPCEASYLIKLKTDYVQQIADLKIAFDELECADESSSTDADDQKLFEGCLKLRESWCVLERDQQAFFDDLDQGCSANADLMKITKDLQMNLMMDQALDPITGNVICSPGFNSVSDYEGALTITSVLGGIIITLDAVITIMNTIQAVAGEIPLVGSATSAPFAAVISVIAIIKAALEVTHQEFDRAFTMLGVRDDDCVANHVSGIEQLLAESFKLQEDNFNMLTSTSNSFSLVAGRAFMVPKVGAGCDGIDNDRDSIIPSSFTFENTPLRTSTQLKRIDEW